MDPFLPVAHRYDPFFPLSSVAQYQVDNWYPATDWQPDTFGNFDEAVARDSRRRGLCSPSSTRATQPPTSFP